MGVAEGVTVGKGVVEGWGEAEGTAVAVVIAAGAGVPVAAGDGVGIASGVLHPAVAKSSKKITPTHRRIQYKARNILILVINSFTNSSQTSFAIVLRIRGEKQALHLNFDRLLLYAMHTRSHCYSVEGILLSKTPCRRSSRPLFLPSKQWQCPLKLNRVPKSKVTND
jgi:hypothetical protein